MSELEEWIKDSEWTINSLKPSVVRTGFAMQLLAMLKRCREQRDEWCNEASQDHMHMIDLDDAELLKIARGEG